MAIDQGGTDSGSVHVPAAIPFPEVPWSWHYGCGSWEVARRPMAVALGSREMVLFEGDQNSVAAIERRCVHMGADLSGGCMVEGTIRCPLHGWEFDRTGQCTRIPAARAIPAFARQQTYPTARMGPHVLVFNRNSPLFDPPFFDGVAARDLLPARPFEFEAEMPWYMVAANGFDIQHFRCAHDRTLLGEPTVSTPSPYAYRIRAMFEVTGRSLRDRLTRLASGPVVTMTVTSWCGTVVLVTAEFARTTSYGMVCVSPVAPNRSRIRNIVWVPRRRGRLRVLDPIDAEVRRWFIRGFIESDRARSQGIRYNPGSLIDADAVLAGYLRWLSQAVRGEALNGRPIV